MFEIAMIQGVYARGLKQEFLSILKSVFQVLKANVLWKFYLSGKKKVSNRIFIVGKVIIARIGGDWLQGMPLVVMLSLKRISHLNINLLTYYKHEDPRPDILLKLTNFHDWRSTLAMLKDNAQKLVLMLLGEVEAFVTALLLF